MSSTERIQGINATRMELLGLRSRRRLAQNGYDLLNRKLETLTAELFSILSKFKEVNEQIRDALKTAGAELSKTEMRMGPLRVKEVSQGFSRTVGIEASSRSLMGVKVPRISLIKDGTTKIQYSLTDTSAQLDEAVSKFDKALELIVRLGEVQSTISKLAAEIQSTKRRVNALKN